jgi:hypothetical protein
MKRLMVVVLALLSVFLALPLTAQAADVSFGFSDEAYTLKYMASINTEATSLESRGGGLNAVIGPLVTLKSGANTVVELDFSIGVALMPDGSPNTQAFGGSFSGGPCWMNRMLCTHWGVRVDPNTGERASQFVGMVDVMPLLNMGAKAAGL